ncbi:MAG TPA: fimbria/pilus periplasmic chaperone [Usitatibacteraceae bacterium]
MKRYFFSALFAGLLSASAGAYAAEFAVSPIKLFFDRQTRSAVVTVSNDAEVPLVVQMSLVRWTQDAEARDVYTESEDFQFFPRLVTIPPKDKRVIRIGVRVPPAGSGELTYRLFINEVLEQKEKTTATLVRLAFRFALPIFVAPTTRSALGEISGITFEPGADKTAGKTVARIGVRNTGSENFRIESIRLAPPQGEAIKESDGWYLLPGASREHSLVIDPVDCGKFKQLELTVRTDKLVLNKLLDVPPSACRK